MIGALLMVAVQASAATAAAAPLPGTLRTYNDWVVGCDNGAVCRAVALMPADGAEAATLAVTRPPAADAEPIITVESRDFVPAAIRVDGAAFRLRAAGENRYAATDPGALARALPPARAARLVDGAGRAGPAVSVSGAAAALLRMDERQGRLGTVSAFVRRGPRVRAFVQAPPLPVVAAASVPRAARPAALPAGELARLRRSTGCEGSDAVAAHPIDARHTLALIDCGGGAYNRTLVPAIVEHGPRGVTARLALFDVGTSDDPDARHPSLVNAAWDPATRRLGSFGKGRGIGDCGTMRSFAWDGRMFRLVHEAQMPECRGSTDYITTWRARVAG